MNTTEFFPPQAYLIGAQKAATTTLAVLLDQHPEITLADPKEPDFFTNNWDRGLDWYCGCFKRLDTLLLDASTSYTMSQVTKRGVHPSDARGVDVPRRIYELRPDAKLIYIVRDPAARTFSAYWHDVRERREKRDLRRLITEEPEFLDPGYYFAQTGRYLEYFSIDQMLFIFFEDFIKDPVYHASQCADFLGLARFPFGQGEVRNESFRYSRLGRLTRELIGVKALKHLAARLKAALPPAIYESFKSLATRPLPRLSEEDRDWLAGFFREDYEAFERLIGHQRGLTSEMGPLMGAIAAGSLPNSDARHPQLEANFVTRAGAPNAGKLEPPARL